jgi:uncharacterized HhH-GPD family protein
VTAEVLDVRKIAPFGFGWPAGREEFDGGWDYELKVGGGVHAIRHALGGRVVYGRQRVHTVTWLDGEVQVEGVEADDYPASQALISLLRRADKSLIRKPEDISAEYAVFEVAEHRREVDAKWSRYSLAVKIREDDLRLWGLHAWLRRQSRAKATAPGIPRPRVQPSARSTPALSPPTLSKQAVAQAMLAHGEALAQALGGGTARFTLNAAANALLHDDPFAFLVAVICDQGIRADRAWEIPHALRLRLGTIDPEELRNRRDDVRVAFATPPKLHRFVNQVADWVVDAAAIVGDRYHRDASTIWAGEPTAANLRGRFDEFPGIGQKKAAMAVEILERDMRVPLTDLTGSDIAYDVHVRRVFLRSGLAEHDDMDQMVRVARSLHPERPGALDNPAWDIGRRWCRPGVPDCPSCPLVAACPREVSRGDSVKGI